jgi:hypothetical protein
LYIIVSQKCHECHHIVFTMNTFKLVDANFRGMRTFCIFVDT